MVVLGLLLVVLGVVAILGGATTTSGSAAFFGFDHVSGAVIFFVGLGSGIAVLLVLGLVRTAARRAAQRRRERKRLTELSDQLDQVERDRRHDDDRDRPTTL